MLNYLTLSRAMGAAVALISAALSCALGEARAFVHMPVAAVMSNRESLAELAPAINIDRPMNVSDRKENPTAQKDTQFLDVSGIEAAIQNALAFNPDKKVVRVVDYSRVPVADGTVSFPLSGANPPALTSVDRPFLWRGFITKADGTRWQCWAVVQVLTNRKIVRTKVSLKAGHLLQSADLETIETPVCPLIIPKDQQLQDYVGLSLRRSIPALARLDREMLETPPIVRSGDRVKVEVVSGRMHLQFEAECRSSAQAGKSVQLMNPSTGRIFKGVAREDGSVFVPVRGFNR